MTSQLANKMRLMAATACLLMIGVELVSAGERSDDGIRVDSGSALQLQNAMERYDDDELTLANGQRKVGNSLHNWSGETEDDNTALKALQLLYGQVRLVKRTPNGFIGMRGKKENADDANSSVDGANWMWRMTLPLETTATERELRIKKSPSGFIGMRGKKYSGEEISRFGEMLRQLEVDELRERMVQDFLDRVATATADENDIVGKRAPIGFTGMRGKRPDGEFNHNMADSVWADAAAEEYKRAPGTGFIGMRGKKETDGDNRQNFKRSPSEAYMGGNGGYGGGISLRSGGKQQRFVDFSNKFVAVRGKKRSFSGALPNDLEGHILSDGSAQTYGGRRHLFEVLSPLLYYSSSNKRAPNGFQGMRGKRMPSEYVDMKGDYVSAAPTTHAALQQLTVSTE